MDDFVMAFDPVEDVPEDDPVISKVSWIPSEEELVNIKNQWRTQGGSGGPCAGFRSCTKCGVWAYCYGASYERQVCLWCFVEKMRPKRKYNKRS